MPLSFTLRLQVIGTANRHGRRCRNSEIGRQWGTIYGLSGRVVSMAKF
jgi:hypothetical protein